MPLGDSNSTDSYDNSLVGLMGPTGNTRIGNNGDRLKVDALVSPSTTQYRKLAYEDAQLARETTVNPTAWVTTYEHSGAGVLYGFLLNLEGAGGAEGTRWYFDILIDNSFSVFGSNGMLFSDLTDGNIYDALNGSDDFAGLNTDTNIVKCDFRNSPIYFASNIKVRIRRTSTAKKFRAGLVKISKD